MDKFGCFVHHALQSFEQLSFQNQQQAIVYPYQPMEQQQASKLVFPDPQTGHLMYQEYNDGDKIIDFSSVGFLEGRSAIPTSNGLLNLPTIIVYPKMQGTDQTDEIQQAIDTVGGYPARKDGLRGVVHFARGTYRLKSCLHIQTSGIILQGAKDGDTVFENKGEMNTLIKVRGGANVLAKKRAPITDATVPVGSQEIHVKHAVKRYNVGDLVVVAVQFNATWVKDIGMDVIHPKGDTSKNNGWRPGRLEHLRTITGIQQDKITLNSPITSRLEQQYGGGYVELYTSHRVSHIGIENLQFVDERNANRTKEDIMRLEKNKVKDYRFASEMFDQILIDIDNAENCWFQNLTSVWWRNFARFGTNTLKMTLKNCRHTFPHPSGALRAPAVPLVGQFAFEISGQQILIDSCHVEHSFHAYAFKGRIPGPNVILRSESTGKLGDVGPHMKWSTGQLYDECNFEGQLIIQDRFDAGSGHGWSGANCVVWNTVAHQGMVVQSPPLAQNFQIGCSPKRGKARKDHSWGWEESPNFKVCPPSLYLAQLQDR